MNVTVKGKQLDVGDALRSHIEQSLNTASSKYFTNPMDAQVVVTREAHQFKVDVQVHVGRNIMAVAHATAGEPYVAADQAIEHVAKRLRRHKRRLRDHNHRSEAEERQLDGVEVPAYVLSPEPSEETAAEGPVVIAELTQTIQRLSVSDAVMRLDLADMPALLFRNAGHGGLNLVYRRPDGNVGWVDPDGNATGRSGRA